MSIQSIYDRINVNRQEQTDTLWKRISKRNSLIDELHRLVYNKDGEFNEDNETNRNAIEQKLNEIKTYNDECNDECSDYMLSYNDQQKKYNDEYEVDKKELHRLTTLAAHANADRNAELAGQGGSKRRRRNKKSSTRRKRSRSNKNKNKKH